VEGLLDGHGRSICYLTSDDADPLLAIDDPRILAFFLGKGSALITAFQALKAGVMVMTTPDLHSYHLKRSVNPVIYAYIHHSMVSTHMAYRPGAFDHFDAILCAGPHHMTETRQWEQKKGLTKKRLFEHGYGPLDSLMSQVAEFPCQSPGKNDSIRVLVAPSWGPNGLLETFAEPLIQSLLEAGHFVTVRPHPHTRQLNPQILNAVRSKFEQHPNLEWEEDIVSHDSLFASHVMISDWSGAALEFAFALERPILFIDVPRKMNNPNYGDIDLKPLEVTIRDDIGSTLAPDQINMVGERVSDLAARTGEFVERIRAVRTKLIYNVGESGAKGAEIIAQLAEESEAREGS